MAAEKELVKKLSKNRSHYGHFISLMRLLIEAMKGRWWVLLLLLFLIFLPSGHSDKLSFRVCIKRKFTAEDTMETAISVNGEMYVPTQIYVKTKDIIYYG